MFCHVQTQRRPDTWPRVPKEEEGAPSEAVGVPVTTTSEDGATYMQRWDSVYATARSGHVVVVCTLSSDVSCN